MSVTFDEFEGEGGNIFEIIDIIQLKQCVIASIERWMTNCRRADWGRCCDDFGNFQDVCETGAIGVG